MSHDTWDDMEGMVGGTIILYNDILYTYALPNI